MNQKLRKKLIQIAENRISDEDKSHDFEHALRVLANVECIAKSEKGDFDIVIPSALFHDLVVHPKNSPQASHSQNDSAKEAEIILKSLKGYPQRKIANVCESIRCCSFSKGIIPNFLEAKILQDADGLEATGAISIMRTFSSTGQMKRPFYQPEDPFCAKRQPDSRSYALDLFYSRLLVVADRMHTRTAKQMARRRTAFLRLFLKELALELQGK